MIKKENHTYIGRYKCPLLYYRLVHQWVNHKNAGDYNIKTKEDGKSLFLDGHMFVNKLDWESIIFQTSEAINKQNGDFFMNFFLFGEEEIQKVLLTVDMLASSDKIEVKRFNEFFSALQDMQFPWMLTIPMGNAIESKIKSLLKKHSIPKETMQQFFIPEKPTLLINQREELNHIKDRLEGSGIYEKIKDCSLSDALKIIKSTDEGLYNNIKEHVKQFEWFGMMHLWGDPFNEKEFIKQVINIKDKPLNKTEGINLPSDLEWLKKHTEKMTYLRNSFAETCAIASYKSLSAIKKAAESLSLTLDDARSLSPEELLDGLKGKAIPSLNIINERKKAFGLVLLDGKSVIITGKGLQEKIDNFLPKENLKILKGVCASPGIAKGRVKLVFSPEDITKVEKGDIIVAPETTPDFLPAFYKATGIITDMGGITGHAAIVSREFSLPCIVGTKNATRVLRDNDLIEINANKGIIKKIK
ncbi:MAG: PEP-utilizing enzyme [Candidatus Nanoarchaeia archaeon]|nr:PEP-utilizing enzyme [Candidatus Nanoarchaeia archaeon]